MKKIFKKFIAVVLCLCIFGGTEVFACGNGMTSTLGTISDLAKRLTSVFVGSQNEKADVTTPTNKIDPQLRAIYNDLEEQMKALIGTKVFINPKDDKKGKIEIEYYSQDELDRIIDLIRTVQR